MRPTLAPKDGQRRDARAQVDRAVAVLTTDGRRLAADLVDVTTYGCRLVLACDLVETAPLTVALSAAALIGGRVTRNDGRSIGVEFCAPLLPRVVASLTAPDHR